MRQQKIHNLLELLLHYITIIIKSIIFQKQYVRACVYLLFNIILQVKINIKNSSQIHITVFCSTSNSTIILIKQLNLNYESQLKTLFIKYLFFYLNHDIKHVYSTVWKCG